MCQGTGSTQYYQAFSFWDGTNLGQRSPLDWRLMSPINCPSISCMAILPHSWFRKAVDWWPPPLRNPPSPIPRLEPRWGAYKVSKSKKKAFNITCRKKVLFFHICWKSNWKMPFLPFFPHLALVFCHFLYRPLIKRQSIEIPPINWNIDSRKLSINCSNAHQANLKILFETIGPPLGGHRRKKEKVFIPLSKIPWMGCCQMARTVGFEWKACQE